MAQVLNIEEVLEALNVAGPADPANAGDGHADHVAQPGGRGGRRGGNRGRGRGRRGRGRGPGFGDPPGCGRGRRVAKKMAKKRTEQQAAAYNRSGRARTSDHRFLESGSLDGRRPTGRGAWKCWTPEAVLRSGFSDEKGAYRQTASQVDGAGHMHAGGSRFVIAGATISGQEKGFQEWKDRSQSDGFLCFVHNLMFDESSFELRPAGRGALESHSILCSHVQSTGITRNQEVLDEHLIRVPKSLCPTNSSTMWRALSAGSGGYDEALSGLQSGFVAFLTTCDAHRANIKLLKFIGQKLPVPALMLPTLCVQHRTGNVIEQVTKFLGNLGGIFCVSKVMAKSHLLAAVKGRVLDYLDQKLVVHQEVPAAVLSEWRASKILLKRLIELTSSFKEEEETNQNSTSAAWKRFMEFFDGPIAGLTVFWGFVCCTCMFVPPVPFEMYSEATSRV